MALDRPSDFHILDMVSLAMERGVPRTLQQVGDQVPIALGPAIEILSLATTLRSIGPLINRYQPRKVISALRAAVSHPLDSHCGGDLHHQWGFFSLRQATVDELREPLYAFQLAARKAIHLRSGDAQVKGRLCGALQELVDNIMEHSGAPQTGIVGFVGSSDAFEMAIGDSGMGMLTSIRTNPTFAYLTDSGSAMAIGLEDGRSRYGLDDRGYGFGTLFRALNALNATLRFRSGDYALEVNGKSPSLRSARISQKATLQGFVVSLKLTI